MDAPTSFLPPLKRLDEYNAPQIHKILTRLVTIYLPKVRGTVLVDEDIESLQSDEFERSFTIRWLTGFIACGEEWTELYTDGEGELGSGAPTITSDASIGRFQTEFLDDTFFARTTAFDRAAALLGACAGTSASGVISREFKFHTSSTPSTDGSVHSDGLDSPSLITILLRDESISTGDHTAVGLQTWGSACILAERVARDPVAFGLPGTSLDLSLESKGARILELGAGTGLLSLLAGKLLERAGAATGTDDSKYTIIATDYHPAVLANLRANVQSNFTDSNSESEPLVEVRPLDWSLYLTGKPTTDLSRAPSTAPTPAVGTPISGCGQSVIEYKAPAVSLDTQTTSISGLVSSPPIQTPSFSGTSSVSTPTTSYSPQTPQTPRTARSPPPNLARAVFSRLIARGLKFEMPGGPPGIDQTSEHAKKSHSYPHSINMEDDSFAHALDLVPTDIHIDPFTDSDTPTIEVEQMIEIRNPTPAQTSSPTRPVDASRSELLCLNHAATTSVSGLNSSNNLTRCLDEIDALASLDNRDMIFHTREDQRPAGSHPLLPGPQVFPIGKVGGSYCPEASNKVVCLGDGSVIGDDSADGTGTPLFNLSEQADGLAHDLSLGRPQAPHMVSPITGPTFAFGEPPTPNTINHDSKTETTVKSDLKTQVNKDTVDQSKYILGGNTSKQGHMMSSQIPGTCAGAPFDQPFDVIFGADIVYELSHVTLVRGVVERLLRKPSYKPGSPPAYFHLIMPLRPTHADEANSVDMAFPRAEDVVGKGASQDEVLAIVKTETYARSAGVGRADEVQYVHYCVGWVLG